MLNSWLHHVPSAYKLEKALIYQLGDVLEFIGFINFWFICSEFLHQEIT